MKLILIKDVDKLGKVGDAVDVKDGYANNFLIPRGLAVFQTKSALRILEEDKKKLAKKEAKKKKEFEALAAKMSSASCTIRVQVGEQGKLFGSVTKDAIVDAYKAEGIDMDKKQIQLDEPIKDLGVFQVPIKLHPEVTANLKVWIVKE